MVDELTTTRYFGNSLDGIAEKTSKKKPWSVSCRPISLRLENPAGIQGCWTEWAALTASFPLYCTVLLNEFVAKPLGPRILLKGLWSLSDSWLILTSTYHRLESCSKHWNSPSELLGRDIVLVLFLLLLWVVCVLEEDGDVLDLLLGGCQKGGGTRLVTTHHNCVTNEQRNWFALRIRSLKREQFWTLSSFHFSRSGGGKIWHQLSRRQKPISLHFVDLIPYCSTDWN